MNPGDLVKIGRAWLGTTFMTRVENDKCLFYWVNAKGAYIADYIETNAIGLYLGSHINDSGTSIATALFNNRAFIFPKEALEVIS